jgi:hypothetical protein
MTRKRFSPRRMGLVVLVALLGLPLSAQELRPVDRPRIEQFDAILGGALRQALAGATPEEVMVLSGALRGEPGEPDPAGDWSCRTIKLGGLLPISVYPPFRCRITETAPNRWRIEKLTGSQRLDGTLSVQEGGVLYLGTGFVDGGPAQPYEAFPPDSQVAVEPGQTYPQVGLFEQAGPGQARLLLPQPMFESDFDILWLSR